MSTNILEAHFQAANNLIHSAHVWDVGQQLFHICLDRLQLTRILVCCTGATIPHEMKNENPIPIVAFWLGARID